MKAMYQNNLLVGPLYEFGSNLFRIVRDSKENVIFSPLSINVCLNMLSLGISDDSPTKKELSQVLGYSNETDDSEIHEAYRQLRSVFEEIKKSTHRSRDDYKLDMVNYAIVKNSGVDKKYLNETNRYYGAALRQVKSDSDQQQTLNEINKWGKEAGFANDILEKNDLDGAHLVLLNGIRVEAFWFKKFHETIIPDSSSPLYKVDSIDSDKASTVKSGKKGLKNDKIRVKYVEFGRNNLNARNEQARAIQADYYDELSKFEFRVIKIPLFGDISYTIIEPLASNGTTKELTQLEDSLLESSLDRMGKLMLMVDDTSAVMANIRMPGFNFERDIDLKKSLECLGLKRIFDEETADLGVMSPDEKIFVDKVKHQAMIEVNETGLKAAAITKMTMNATSLDRDVIDVIVENPFLYVIRFKEVPLFIGHFVKA